VRAIHGVGAEAGLALNPVTPLHPYCGLLAEVDTVLIMSIEPGFGGQKFIDFTLDKIREARKMIDDLPRLGHREPRVWLQVDGGVDADTIARCAEAGADSFVAGSAVYCSDDPAAAVRGLRGKADSQAPTKEK
jgi:ribulose-phosphate 3-epimerase